MSYQVGSKRSILYKRNQNGVEEFGDELTGQQDDVILVLKFITNVIFSIKEHFSMQNDMKSFTVAEFMFTKFGSMRNRENRDFRRNEIISKAATSRLKTIEDNNDECNALQFLFLQQYLLLQKMACVNLQVGFCYICT